MKKLLPLLLLPMVLCLVAGCEPVPHYNRVQAASLTGYPVKVPVSKHGKIKPYGSVKLFQSKAEVSGKYTVLAIMTVSGEAGDEARFITAFLYRAADMGADAVVLDRGNGGVTVTTQVNVGRRGAAHLAGAYRAEAIRFENAL